MQILSVHLSLGIPANKVFFHELELLPFTVRQKAQIYWLLGYICILFFAKRLAFSGSSFWDYATDRSDYHHLSISFAIAFSGWAIKNLLALYTSPQSDKMQK